MKKSKLALLTLLLVTTTTLSSCDAVDKESLLDKLFPNPYDALAVFLAFVVLLVVVFFVAYKPVKKLLKQRGDYVEGKIKDADEKQNEANDILNNANEELKNSKIEGRKIIEKAKIDANKERENILELAKKEKELEVNKAKQEIAQEIEANKDEIHREIVSTAIDASSRVLKREVTTKDNEQLIDSFIDELNEGK